MFLPPLNLGEPVSTKITTFRIDKVGLGKFLKNQTRSGEQLICRCLHYFQFVQYISW